MSFDQHGTRNMSGLKAMAEQLTDAFSAPLGMVELVARKASQAISASGTLLSVEARKHLVVRVQPEADRRVLLTGHMDTVGCGRLLVAERCRRLYRPPQ